VGRPKFVSAGTPVGRFRCRGSTCVWHIKGWRQICDVGFTRRASRFRSLGSVWLGQPPHYRLVCFRLPLQRMWNRCSSFTAVGIIAGTITAGTGLDFTGAVMRGVAALDGVAGRVGTAGEADIAATVLVSGVSEVVFGLKVVALGWVAAPLGSAAAVPVPAWAAALEVAPAEEAVAVAVEAAAMAITETFHLESGARQCRALFFSFEPPIKRKGSCWPSNSVRAGRSVDCVYH
jgi:hypothetical protein